MRIALFSDLHLELGRTRDGRPAWEPPDLDVDVVVLAGDIGSHTHGLEWAAETFPGMSRPPVVLYISGNHEYYGAHLGLLDEMRKASRPEKGVHFMERNAIELVGVRFLGCTLWSGFDLLGAVTVEASLAVASQRINDYWVIRGSHGRRLTPRETLALHRRSVDWLDHELAKPFEGKTVVVTHFAPHRRCVAPEHENSDISPYFVTDLSDLMSRHRIDVWCHGHTHTNNDFVAENGCRVVSNQRGYPGMEEEDFRAGLVIEV